MPDNEDNKIADKSPVMPQVPNFTSVKSPDFRSVYCNNAMFQSGVFELAITFGEIMEVDQEAKTATVEQKVRVVMAPLHGKLLAAALMQQLKAYEATFGELKIPQGLEVKPTGE